MSILQQQLIQKLQSKRHSTASSVCLPHEHTTFSNRLCWAPDSTLTNTSREQRKSCLILEACWGSPSLTQPQSIVCKAGMKISDINCSTLFSKPSRPTFIILKFISCKRNTIQVKKENKILPSLYLFQSYCCEHLRSYQCVQVLFKLTGQFLLTAQFLLAGAARFAQGHSVSYKTAETKIWKHFQNIMRV